MVSSFVVEIVVKILLAGVLKLLCGFDDVVWLSPFMARATPLQRWGVALRYVGVVFMTATIAVVLANILRRSIADASNIVRCHPYLVSRLAQSDNKLDRIISAVSGALLAGLPPLHNLAPRHEPARSVRLLAGLRRWVLRRCPSMANTPSER